ncbi:MAG: hypothetical protein GY941_20675 [Planctomycetes bacterium]|nr:hypothetical protein [Planctomycetota bacterium]
MKIKTSGENKSGASIIEVAGNLIGRGSEQLKAYLFDCLDRGKDLHLLDFKKVKKIDGLGINTICNFVNRGMGIYLFNVHSEVRGMLQMSGKEGLVNVINECLDDEYVSLLEKDFLENKDIATANMKRRRHVRIGASFPLEFKYVKENSGVVRLDANVLNLSHGGMQADRVRWCIDAGGRLDVGGSLLEGIELHGIKFELNGGSEPVEANGECAWESNSFNNLSVGICFTEMSDSNRNRIHEYVDSTYNTYNT